MSNIMIEAKNLKKYFAIRESLTKSIPLKAVDDVSFAINKGETLGLVGESGCGKTTVGRTLIRLYEPTGGQIIFDREDITRVKMAPYRRRMQMVFQDPYSSLNPRMTIADVVAEPLDICGLAGSKRERRDRVTQLLDLVGLNSEHMSRYPHEFSGGQRQRVSIARALAVKPEFMVCDEPISALDVSIQAQVINMLMELQQSLELTYLFIAHDLSVVRHISTHIAVMYLGHIVELCGAIELYKTPQHPYSQSLLSAIPVPEPRANRAKKRVILTGDVPSPLYPPQGCPFVTRCGFAREICGEEMPALKPVSSGHSAACHMVAQGW